MKKVVLKYNPYLVTTEVMVDGKTPKGNSALNVGKKRLQEWVEQLPNILIEEYRDKNVAIEFTGSKNDFDDIKTAFDSYSDISATWEFHKTADISDVEKTIDKIFQDIQNGPIKELKDKKIIKSFEKAKDSRFEINVVATMSSGKSTLINALLGQQLMPAANKATTATIVKIVDTNQEKFSAVAYDKSSQVVEKLEEVTLEDMKKLNVNPKVSTVELRGKIPFVSSVGMKLVLVDTPGPNNSRDKRHEEMTYKMIADSDKSLVLFVMNGEQLDINDEKIFLDYVCQSMREGGKQARERFIFAINKMDSYNPSPKKDDTGCIERALQDVKSGLEDRGIYNPNIFPICALPALEKRENDPDSEELELFKNRCEKYPELHLEKYNNFNNLPQSVCQRIDKFKQSATDEDLIEIHTGIVSIEQAIAQYINKYARITKVCDLVLAFNEKLNELAAVAHLEDEIRKDKSVKATLEKQIEQIKKIIHSAAQAQERSRSIDKIDLTASVETKVKSYIEDINNKLSKMLSGYSMVEKATALKEGESLEKECRAIDVQIKVQINQILDKAYKDTITNIIEEYKRHLADLHLGINNSALSFNAVNLVSGSLADLSSIIENNTVTKDESYYVEDTKQVFVKSTRKWYNPLSWFGEGDHYETKTYQKKISKYKDEVPMDVVASDYIVPFQKFIMEKIPKAAIEHVKSETARLKEHLKLELKKIDKVLNEKLDALSKTEADDKAKAAEIAQKEANLKWLESVQKRVNDIINF